MKVGIIGANGYIGKKVSDFFSERGKHEIELITRSKESLSVDDAFASDIDIFINCVGRVGKPSVEEFDTSTMAYGQAVESNISFVRHLLLLRQMFSKGLIHLSTGCFFKGDNFFEEHEHPNFITNAYLETKWKAEQEIMNNDGNSDRGVAICRIRMPFDNEVSPRNLSNKYLNYKKLLTGKNSITYIPHLCEALHMMVDAYKLGENIGGIYHFVNPFPIDTILTQKLINRYWGIEKEIVEVVGRVERSVCTLSNAASRDKFESFGKTFPFTKCYEPYCESYKILKSKIPTLE